MRVSYNARVSEEKSRTGAKPLLERLGEEAAALPAGPGVYLMKGGRGEVLYVGKAKSLKDRVRTYFRGGRGGRGGDGRSQIAYLLRRVRKLDFVVTRTEKEAIILENTLIKKHKPRYNIVFRDDKTYAHVKLSVKDEWPRLYVVRRPRKDGSKFYGPYASAHSLRQTLETLQEVFPLRTCSDHELASRRRPCLEYEIGRCLAPCVGKIGAPEYAGLVRQVDLYLSGRREQLLKQMEQEMRAASEARNYEHAAEIRDRVAAIRRTLERQQVWKMDDVDRDAFALVEVGEEVWVQGVFVRGGSVVESRGFAIQRRGFDLPEVVSQFLPQFYADENHVVPEEVLLPVLGEGMEALEEWLGEKRGGKVKISVPRRGDRRELLEMAENNAREAAARRYEAAERQERVLKELQEKLFLRRLPRRIECFDISHLQGDAAAASMVVFVNGEPDKSLYKKFELRGVPAGDDYAALSQVLTRRFLRALPKDVGEPVPSGWELPDLIVVDGGKGQLGILEEVLKALEMPGRPDCPDHVSLAKSRVLGPGSKAGDFGKSDERVFAPGAEGPLVLAQDSAPLHLLSHLRDESHRFALAYHRKLSAKLKFHSVLDDIPGIGKKRRIALLKHFGSVEGIRKAAREDLEKAPLLNKRAAGALWKHFRG